MLSIQKRYIIVPLLLVFALHVSPQVPSDNPYKTKYVTKNHWTEKIEWKKVKVANDVPGLVDGDNAVDSALLAGTMQSISQEGGGVLYFNMGIYYFNYDLQLFDGVILRGVPTAGQATISPSTKFIFPLLILDNGWEQGNEKFVTTTPKIIYNSSASPALIGMVDIDISRAVIWLNNKRIVLPGGGTGREAAAEGTIKDLLLLNIRSNNSVLLDPAIPTSTQAAFGQEWQIWPQKKAANIDVAVSGNYTIAGCRINDHVTDSILQHDFVTDDGMKYDGTEAQFLFADHPGIQVRLIEKPGQPARTMGEIKDNFIFTGKGNTPLLVNDAPFTGARNTTGFINQQQNLVTDGHVSQSAKFDLLYKNQYPSELKHYYSTHGDTLPYRLIKPDNYDPSKKYPVVIYLHDFWGKGNDGIIHLRQYIWQLLSDENRKKYPCFIIAPQLPVTEPKWKPDGGLGSETWPLQATANILKNEIKNFSIDPARVYAIGHSMGGAGVIHFATHYPEILAAAVPVSAFYKFTPNAALQLARVPSWFIYGGLDNKISAVIRQTIRLDLRDAGANFKFTEIPGKAHRCWNTITETMPDLLPWIFSQRQK
jgi:dienelactone hydrolase